jgi:RHS repeat-associated protein
MPSGLIEFTGKERDAETGLDYFGARYFSAAQGRFTSPDPVYFQQEMLADPQRFNLYAYARNNPLKFTDPSGEAIELTGDTDEARKRQLAAIQDAVGKEAAKRLNIVQDKDTGKYMVGIQGDVKSFSAINAAAGSFATIIGMSEVAKFGVVSSAQTLELSGQHGPLSLNQGGVGVTGRDNEGQLWVYVQRPSEGYSNVEADKMSGLSWLNRLFGIGGTRDEGIVTGHEFGHALGLMEQRQAGQPTNVDRTNPEALKLENQVRKIKDPNGPVRVAH